MSTLFVKYEGPTIRAFFPPEKRERFLQLLGKSNRRPDALKILHHSIIFDPKWSTPVDSKSDIVDLLKAKGAGSKGYLMGTSRDQRILPLDEAFACVHTWPTGLLPRGKWSASDDPGAGDFSARALIGRPPAARGFDS